VSLLNDAMGAIPMTYAALFPVLNPLGFAFVFLALTDRLSGEARKRLSRKIAINTFVLLTLVLWVGEWVLRFFGVTIPIVQIAGGLVVSSIGWILMNQSGDADASKGKAIMTEKEADEQAFFPLTMPLTAGPGCIAVALTIGAHESFNAINPALASKMGAMVGIFLAALTVYFSYAYADRITHKLGTAGTKVITKLSAFIIFCIGLTIFWHGLRELIPVLS
jgi:multiple antibiotic resistance protein